MTEMKDLGAEGVHFLNGLVEKIKNRYKTILSWITDQNSNCSLTKTILSWITDQDSNCSLAQH